MLKLIGKVGDSGYLLVNEDVMPDSWDVETAAITVDVKHGQVFWPDRLSNLTTFIVGWTPLDDLPIEAIGDPRLTALADQIPDRLPGSITEYRRQRR